MSHVGTRSLTSQRVETLSLALTAEVAWVEELSDLITACQLANGKHSYEERQYRGTAQCLEYLAIIVGPNSARQRNARETMAPNANCGQTLGGQWTKWKLA